MAKKLERFAGSSAMSRHPLLRIKSGLMSTQPAILLDHVFPMLIHVDSAAIHKRALFLRNHHSVRR